MASISVSPDQASSTASVFIKVVYFEKSKLTIFKINYYVHTHVMWNLR